MTKRKRAAIKVAILSVVCGLIIWHVIHWYSTGVYFDMFQWSQTGRGWVTGLYNLGLMLALGSLLGLLMEAIIDLLRS